MKKITKNNEVHKKGGAGERGGISGGRLEAMERKRKFTEQKESFCMISVSSRTPEFNTGPTMKGSGRRSASKLRRGFETRHQTSGNFKETCHVW